MTAAVLALLLASGGAVLDVPAIRQQKDGCGAAVTAMVIRYWRARVPGLTADDDPARIMQRLYAPEVKGIRGQDMADYFRAQGFRAFVIGADESDLRHHVSLGRPLIVCLRSGGATGRHFVVVVGADVPGQTISFIDPARGTLAVWRADRFRAEWAETGYWTLLAVPESVP